MRLQRVELDDDALVMTDNMVQLQKVELVGVCMSSEAWNRFVTSLRSVKRTVDVTLEACDIDDEARNVVGKSKHLNVATNWKPCMFGWSITLTSPHNET